MRLERLEVPAAHQPAKTICIQAICGTGVQEREVVKGRFFRRGEGDGRIYLDGSGKAPLTCYARSAGSVVQVEEDGRLIRGLTFVAPEGWPQTAAAAEHLAMTVAQDYAEQGLVPVTDCGSVYRSAAEGPRCATHEKRPWAAIWADIRGWLGPPLKVEAHLTQ